MNETVYLVVGGTSQDARALIGLLEIQGSPCHVTYRKKAANLGSCKNSYILDPCNKQDVIALITDIKPDVIFLLAAQSSVFRSFSQPLETFSVNTSILLSFLEAIHEVNSDIKLFYPLSTEIFGTLAQPATELSAHSPLSPYGLSKASCREWLSYYRNLYGLNLYGGILGNHESQYRPPTFVTHKLAQAAIKASKDASTIVEFGNLGIIRDWGWAEEYMYFALQLIEKAQPGDYIISTGVSATLASLAEEMFKCLNLDASLHIVQSPQLYRENELLASYTSPELLKKTLGSVPQITYVQVAERLIKLYTGNAHV